MGRVRPRLSSDAPRSRLASRCGELGFAPPLNGSIVGRETHFTAMANITYLKGDATSPGTGGQRIICHICNDVGGWGKGFVLALTRRWPEPEAQYRAWSKLGESAGFRLGAIQLVRVEPTLSVANMIAQRGIRPSDGVPPIRYDALRLCLVELAREAVAIDASVHMPRIGCGLAGGSWPEVELLIEATLSAAGVSVHVYDF